MMKNILVLPLDDRPCHTDFLLEACRYVEDVHIEIVPKEILGHFQTAGDCEKMTNYLEERIQNVSTLILSIDGFVFGGLIQARSMEICDIHTALIRLKFIEDLKKRNPDLKILAYSVVMRLTTSVIGTKALRNWENIFKYSQLVHKAEIYPELLPELKRIESCIDEDVLEDYLQTRKRNHEVNKACIELLKEKLIDYLVFVQEDTNEYGLHRKEQQILKQSIQENHLKEKCVLKNGADEMAALLLARELNDKEMSVTLETTYLDKNFIALYEDTPVIQNLLLSFQIANIQISEQKTNPVLLVLPTKQKSCDLCFEPLAKDPSIQEEQIEYYKKYNGRKIALLDVQNSNGGDIRDVEILRNALENSIWIGYSAWNTASNAIGTLVLDLVIDKYYQRNEEYLEKRIVDDAIYQGMVRSQFNSYLNEHHIDVWKEASEKKHEKYLNELLQRELLNYPWIKNHYKVSLPWGRTFEAILEIENGKI